MRLLFAALALALAPLPFAAVHISEPSVRIAQMSRDVTDAVRKQRGERRERRRAQGDHSTNEGRR